MSEWKIARRRGACEACGNAFVDEQKHYSSLVLSEGELRRRDDCEKCFAASADAARLVWWRTAHRSAKRGLVLDLESLAGLFHALAARGERELVELRYLVCLLLLRKRRLKLRRCERGPDGRESLIVSAPRRSDEHVVVVAELGADRQLALAQSLERVIDGADAGEVGALRPAAEAVSEDAGPGSGSTG